MLTRHAVVECNKISIIDSKMLSRLIAEYLLANFLSQ